MSSGHNYFGLIDYLTVAFTLVFSLGIGVYHAFKSRGKRTNEEMLLGGRSMSAFPVGASMLVTFFSAVNLIGFPAEIYGHGIQVFGMQMILVFFCIPIAAVVYMKVLYNLKLTSVYEYLQLRFDSEAVRCFASGLAIFQMTLSAGMVLYAPSIPMEAFLGLPSWISILTLGLCGTIYTSIGGFKAVIWADVFQLFLIIVGMLAIVIRGFVSAGGFIAAFEKASEHGRLNLFDWNLDLFQRQNSFNHIFGYAVLLTLHFGTNQPAVQRYSSLPSFKEAVKAVFWNGALKEFTILLVICTGVSIFGTFAGCDPILLGEINKQDQIVSYFFVKELSWIPGMLGLFTSCIFSAVLSSISSFLNSLAAITWTDFLSRLPIFDKTSDTTKGGITMILAALYGFLSIGIAFGIGQFGSIFQIFVTLTGVFGGAIGGGILCGLFLPFVNKVGVIFGMGIGLLIPGFIAYQSKFLPKSINFLPTSLDSCPEGTDFSMAKNSSLIFSNHVEYEWPTKLYTISYLLYPTIGIILTMSIASIVSLISKPFMNKQSNSRYKYLHPIVNRICKRRPLDTKVDGKLCKDCYKKVSENQHTDLEIELDENISDFICSNDDCVEKIKLTNPNQD